MQSSKKKEPDKKPSISYWTKQKCHCPVCKKDFRHEEMLSGNGRMIAGGLTDELHRIYEPSARYGKVYPLIYAIGCCPNCHAAMFWGDFPVLQDKGTLERIYDDEENRLKQVNEVFPYFNLERERTLYDGAAMYYMALLTYSKMDVAYLPTLKQGIIALRLSWLCRDLDIAVPNHNFSVMAETFVRKAIFFYQQAVINETARVEQSSSISNFGPDIDKNYGWDGVIYLCGLLEYKYGQQNDHELRLRKLEEYKTAIARIFGFGKSSKNKPGPLLEHSRNLYEALTKELEASTEISLGEM
ncbi:MAG: DUF2225 domain-containing protein [Treponema sp.]|nr:DUF2225 domain-containing protein [Treponema sp.]